MPVHRVQLVGVRGVLRGDRGCARGEEDLAEGWGAEPLMMDAGRQEKCFL